MDRSMEKSMESDPIDFKNGAELLVAALRAIGVRTIFTLSGNQIMPIFDACNDADIKLVHVRHEAAAVYMAEAWAQLNGDIGVALIPAGPGAIPTKYNLKTVS